MDLTITQAESGGKCVLHLTGSLDLVSRDEMLAAGNRALGEEQFAGVVLNLAEIGFIDSTGIGALVELSRSAEDAGKSFALQDPSARVRRVLNLTGLEGHWAEEPSATPS